MVDVKGKKAVVFVGHSGSGKTSCIDAMLYKVGANSRHGSVDQGSSMCDYGDDEIADIIERSAKILEIDVDRESAKKIARRSRLTPRVANRLLKRVRDWAQVKGQGVINPPIVQDALSSLHIDEKGLETGDRRVLKTIIEKFEGGPVGVQAISAASSEEMEAIIDIYEPYLMKIGLIKRTPQGRVATKLAYKHLNIEPSSRQKDLF